MNLSLERRWWHAGFPYVAGIDEAGRGPLAGPVFAAAVILKNTAPCISMARNVKDSKLLSHKQRVELYKDIITSCHSYAVASVNNVTIDSIGILPATKRAMMRAVSKLRVQPDALLIDAVSLPINNIPQTAIIHGDRLVASIAAASILAKVARDSLMDRYEKKYPSFSFTMHRGYGTAQHFKELRKSGITPIHRVSFEPVKSIMQFGKIVSRSR